MAIFSPGDRVRVVVKGCYCQLEGTVVRTSLEEVWVRLDNHSQPGHRFLPFTSSELELVKSVVRQVRRKVLVFREKIRVKDGFYGGRTGEVVARICGMVHVEMDYHPSLEGDFPGKGTGCMQFGENEIETLGTSSSEITMPQRKTSTGRTMWLAVSN